MIGKFQFEELLDRHDRCDADQCVCPNGRHEDEDYTIWEIVSFMNMYSDCPKSGHPDFGVFQNRPVVKSSGCLKSGHKRLDFECSVHSLYNVRLSVNQPNVR